MEVVRVRQEVRDAIVAHAREEAPNECCGLLIGCDGAIVESVRARNLRRSPSRYLLDPATHVRTIRRLRGTGRDVLGAYHSHPHTRPIPSETDRAEALYPDFVWVIVSLLEPEGDVAGFRIAQGSVTPVALVLEC